MEWARINGFVYQTGCSGYEIKLNNYCWEYIFIGIITNFLFYTDFVSIVVLFVSDWTNSVFSPGVRMVFITACVTSFCLYCDAICLPCVVYAWMWSNLHSFSEGGFYSPRKKCVNKLKFKFINLIGLNSLAYTSFIYLCVYLLLK